MDGQVNDSTWGVGMRRINYFYPTLGAEHMEPDDVRRIKDRTERRRHPSLEFHLHRRGIVFGVSVKIPDEHRPIDRAPVVSH